MIAPLIATILAGVGIVFLFGLTPETVTTDLMDILRPHDSLRKLSTQYREKKAKHRLYDGLVKLNSALTSTGKSNQFSVVCACSVLGIVVGAVLSIFIGNIFLLPALTVACALAPFFYTNHILIQYEKNIRMELEATLALVTTSYIRTEDILIAVKENIPYIRHPLHSVFQAFLNEATYITSSVPNAIIHMKAKVDNDVFQEWCDLLIRCQEDKSLKDTLQPTVTKLTDMRIVNNELITILLNAKMEYWTMAALMAGSVPLMYVVNRDWFHILMNTIPGQIVVGISATVLLVTALLAEKYTRPIKFKK